MPAKRLKEFLDENHVKYVSITHSRAFTAQEIAASAHIPGRELAKTVLVKIDDEIAMAVLPAAGKVNLKRLCELSGAGEAALAGEEEFRDLFPDCDLGAMPPFGNIYGLEVYCSAALAADEFIAFNAGSHTELIQLAYVDFARLVRPRVVEIQGEAQ